MRIAALTNIADDSRTMLSIGLTQQWREPLRARTNAMSVIAVLPFAFLAQFCAARWSVSDMTEPLFL